MDRYIYIGAGLLVLALLTAAVLYRPRRQPLLYVFRTLALFFLFLFLWNPSCDRQTSVRTKPVLTLVRDYSWSQKPYVSMADSLTALWMSDPQLNDQFEIRRVWFARDLMESRPDSFVPVTSLSGSLASLYEHKNKNRREAWILLTDGIQTEGGDYAHMAEFWKNVRIYPLVLGDTARYPDLRVGMPEYNTETGKGNIFPVNVSFFYDYGHLPVETEISVSEKGKVLKRERIRFDSRNRYVKKHWRFEAGSPGWHTYVISIKAFEGEKNTANNKRIIRFRVVDRKASVLILYGGLHPDAGVIRRILETEKKYKITVSRQMPREGLFDLIVAVQPTAQQVALIRKSQKPVWWITGVATDWDALNKHADWFAKHRVLRTPVDYLPRPARDFSLFRLPGFPSFPMPPLRDKYGRIRVSGDAAVVWYGTMEGDTALMPLIALHGGRNEAAVFGQGIWRWYMQEKKNTSADRYMRELVLRIASFLMHKPHGGLLRVVHRPHYDRNSRAVITVQALNTLYEPRENARLRFLLYEPDGKTRKLPLFYENGLFKVFVDSLKPGFYRYAVHYKDYGLHRYGGFRVDSIPAEFRLHTADTVSLHYLASSTGGKVFFPGEARTLSKYLKENSFFKPRISVMKRRRSFTDNGIWLLLAVLVLALEWIWRKSRGRL